MTETFYDRLGVAPDATTEEIETAYRAAIKEVHPDVSDAADASERTKRLNRAKRVLTDEEERARYDRVGHAAYTDDGPSPSTPDGSATTDRSGDERTDPSTSGRRSSGRRSRHRSRRRARSSDRERRRRDARNATDDGRGANGDDERVSGGTGGPSETNASAGASGATRSRTDSRGPSWQSGSVGQSRSARRQAAASGPDGPNVDWSWNSWNPREAWAVRQGEATRGLHPARLFPTGQSLVLVVSTIFCYPFFVGSVLFPPFPLVARLTVLLCTLFMFAYLLSIPEVAILVYGFWSVVGTLGLLLWPGVSLLSLLGVVVVTATWVPLGLSVLTFEILRP